MRILVTNDDGFDSPGLKTLRDIALNFSDDVWVVAPEVDQSGAAHSLTLREPLRMKQWEERLYAVRGTPADCVIMGIRLVLKDKRPDLVLSGVNRGANMGEDITYSGTVAGAIEGTLMGIRSIAFSQASALSRPGGPAWQTALRHGPTVIERLLDEAWGEGVFMNVNFPDREPDEIEGVQITRQGRRSHDRLNIDERHDTWNQPYYWLAYEFKHVPPPEGTDINAVHNGFISVTPLSIDFTADAVRQSMQTRY
ncbi:MAG: hypothetical protein RLZ98_3479 [Pseudomonadota bacterium]|jgi:5'-nucleotidase